MSVDGITRRKHATGAAEGALLAAAPAAAAAVALATEGMDDESSDDEQLQSSPLGTAPPSLPPGPPDDAPDAAPLGSAGYGEMAVSEANPLTPAEAEATLEAGAALVGVESMDLPDLECLAELPDEAARQAFRSFTPDPSSGRGAGPYWAPCAADGRPFALEVKPEPVPAPLPTSAPLQPGSFFMYGTSAQAQRGGPMPRRASEIVAAHQHEMVASFLQHQHNSAGQTELAEDSFSSVMSEATTQQQQFVPYSEPTQQHQFVPLQQHQFVPAPQFVRHNSSSSSLMSVVQQPTPDATCATVISEATSVLAVAQNLVPQHVDVWSKCFLGSAPARLLCLLRARLAALGSSALPGRALQYPVGSRSLLRFHRL